MEIRNFEKGDVGEYTAALDEKEVSAPAHVQLEVAPEISIREKLEAELVLHAHSELAFHVEAAGHPSPSVTILHNESRIQNRALVEEYDNVISVRMKNLVREDCGVVKITAENEFGETHKEIRLTVIDVPSEPLVLVASDTTMDSTTLSWSHPEKTNGAPLTGFIIERKAVDSNRWRPVGKTNASTLKFLATDLFSNQVYGFRIIAVNSAGEGPPSQTVDVLTMEDNESKLDSSESSILCLLETPETPEAKLEGANVTLTWKAVPEAVVYIVERQRDNGEWLEIARLEKTCFVDTSLVENAAYCYRISAKSLSAESRPSDITLPLSITVGHTDEEGADEYAERAEVIDNGEKVNGVSFVNGELLENEESKVADAILDGDATPAIEIPATESGEEKKKKKVVKKKAKEAEEALHEELKDDVTEGVKTDVVASPEEGQEVPAKRAALGEDAEILTKKVARGKKEETLVLDGEKKHEKVVETELKTESPAEQKLVVEAATQQALDEQAVKVEALVLQQKADLVKLKLGEKGELTVSSSSPAVFTWTKDGRSLPNDFALSGDTTSSTVGIPFASPEFAGEYKCVATSKDGQTATTSTTVKVEGKILKSVLHRRSSQFRTFQENL